MCLMLGSLLHAHNASNKSDIWWLFASIICLCAGNLPHNLITDVLSVVHVHVNMRHVVCHFPGVPWCWSCLHRYPGPPPVDCPRLLEDGVGTEILRHRHGYRTGRETNCMLTQSTVWFVHLTLCVCFTLFAFLLVRWFSGFKICIVSFKVILCTCICIRVCSLYG